MDIILVQSTHKDSAEVNRILNVAFAEFKPFYTAKAYRATVLTPEEVLKRIDAGFVWLAKSNAGPSGTVSAMIENKCCYIKSMAVDPIFQGKGIGRILLEHVESFAREMSCNKLSLSTTPYLDAAILLYKSFGFEIINEGPYDLHGTPLFTMRKII